MARQNADNIKYTCFLDDVHNVVHTQKPAVCVWCVSLTIGQLANKQTRALGVCSAPSC